MLFAASELPTAVLTASGTMGFFSALFKAPPSDNDEALLARAFKKQKFFEYILNFKSHFRE